VRKSNLRVERKNVETGKDRGKHWIEICANICRRRLERHFGIEGIKIRMEKILETLNAGVGIRS